MKPNLQRRIQRYGWDLAAPYYDNSWKRQLRPAQRKLLSTAGVDSGDSVLDISCGTGLVTKPLKQMAGPDGSVTGIDLSEEMVESAREQLSEKADHLHFLRMDAEELDFEDNCFDSVICSLGLMYYPKPEKAIREMYRVAKPGGACSSLVWGARKQCGWASIFPIVDRRVQSDVCPLFFRLGTGNTLKNIYQQTGFRDVTSQRFSSKLLFEDDEEACTAAFLGGPVALAYQKFDDATKSEVHEEYLESIQPYKKGSVFKIPGEFVITRGIK